MQGHKLVTMFLWSKGQSQGHNANHQASQCVVHSFIPWMKFLF